MKFLKNQSFLLLFSISLLMGIAIIENDFYKVDYFLPTTVILFLIPVFVFEFFAPADRKQKSYRHLVRDLLWVCLCTLVVEQIFGVFFRESFIEAATLMNRRPSFFKWQELGPFWLQVLGSLTTVNFLKYWAHRWEHQNPFLWKFHAQHHSIQEYYTVNSVYNHPIDFLVRSTIPGFLNFMIGWSFEATILGYFINFFIIWNAHANIYQPLPKWFHCLITTNHVHIWHHHPKIGRSKNFSTSIAFFDLIFGTLFLPDNSRKPKHIGLGRDPYPQEGFWKIMMFPFRTPLKKTLEKPLPTRSVLEDIV